MSDAPLDNPSSAREVAKAALVVALGIAGVTVLASLYGLDATATAWIVGITLVSALVAAVLGVGVLYAGRRRSVGSQAGLLFLVAGAGAALAAWITARRMFVSEHDFGVLMMVLIVAGASAGLGAIAFGRRINALIRRMIFATRTATISSPLVLPDSSAPRELRTLARELTTMSQRLTFEQAQTETLERSRRELVAWISGDVEAHLRHLEGIATDLDPAMEQRLRDEVTTIRATVADISELLRDAESTSKGETA